LAPGSLVVVTQGFTTNRRPLERYIALGADNYERTGQLGRNTAKTLAYKLLNS
jgi:hypothetical protein